MEYEHCTSVLKEKAMNCRVWVSLSVVLLLSAIPLFAQVTNNTSLVGTVTDTTGQAVAGAKVTAVNVATNEHYSATTGEDGSYTLTFVREGAYTITVERAGFAKSIQQGIVVDINRTVRTDVTLKMGSVSESVTVNAGAPPVSTDDATIAETLSTRSVVDLPLNGRDALKLAATTSDVIVGPKSNQTAVPPGEDFIGAGQREITNSLTLDGITIMNNLITVTNVQPNVDAVEEVQVQTGNYTAQYGSYMGVHVNLATKSGTNELHGAVFEFVRNSLFDAHSFFDPLGSPKKPLHINQFGAEVGGPVYLPKLYNGRNKTFFMASYEGLRQIKSPSQLGTTFTQAMRSGDFSALCTAGFNASGLCNTASQQIHNPITLAPYPNNMIPSNQLSGVSQALLQYYPLPNIGTNTFSGPVAVNVSTNQTLERIDQNIGDKIRLFVRYDWQNTHIFGGNITPTSGSYGPAYNRNLAIGYTHIITQNIINDFRLGRNHLMTNNLNYWTVNNLLGAGTKLGIPNFTGDTTFHNPGIPDITVSGFMGLGNAGSNWYQDDTTWHGYDQVSYRHGSHNFMAGAEIRKLTTGRAAANSPRGLFNFTGSRSGNAAAGFMLGTAQNV